MLVKNITEKFSETVCPTHWVLFIYISTYWVETVKQLDYNRLGGSVERQPLCVQEVPGSIFGCG